MAAHDADTQTAPHTERPGTTSCAMAVRRILPALLLPLLIWGACTLFLGADLGKSSDDYFLNLRDPVTGDMPEGTTLYQEYPYFWRPLHIAMTFGVGTYLWEHDRAIHVFVALMHGAACLGLWLLLRRTLHSAIAPGAAMLLFMANPMNFEVVLWFSTACTSIGAAIFFGTTLLVVRFSRSDRGGYALLAPIFVLTFLVTCFYEQSAAGAAALPALCLAVAPRAQPWRTRLLRAGAATAAAGLACVLYIVLFRATAPPFARGAAASMVKGERFGQRMSDVGGAVADGLWGERARHTWAGSLQHGWEAAASPEGVVWGGLILAAAATWLVWAWRAGAGREAARADSDIAREAQTESSVIRRAWLAAFGLGMFVAAWLPVMALDRQNVVPRNFYVPLLGLAIAVGALLDAVMAAFESSARCAPARRWAAVVIGLLALSVALPGSVGMIGFQTLVQARWRLDQSELRQLVDLVPAPPPGAVFVPINTRTSLPAHTGLIMYDKCRPGVFETSWSASSALRHRYRRSDIYTTSSNPWLPTSAFLRDPCALDVRYMGRVAHGGGFFRPPEGGTMIPWDRAIPFTIDPEGRVRLVRRIDVERTDHRDLAIRPPVVHRIIADRRARGLTTPVAPAALADTEERLDLLPIEEWEWDATHTPVEFTDVWIWPDAGGDRRPRRATWLHTGAQNGERRAISVAMPARERAQLLLLRAAIAEYDLRQVGLLPPTSPAPASAPPVVAAVQELVVRLASDPKRELGVMRLDPGEFASGKRWLPLIVEIPGTTTEDRWVVTLRIAPGQPKDARPLPVWITQGFEQLPPLTSPTPLGNP